MMYSRIREIFPEEQDSAHRDVPAHERGPTSQLSGKRHELRDTLARDIKPVLY